MFKKDYVLIADTFKRNRVKIKNISDPTVREYRMQSWYDLVLDFADQLSLSERKFDRLTFIKFVLEDK